MDRIILEGIEALRHELLQAASFLEASEIQVRLNALYWALAEELRAHGLDRRESNLNKKVG